MKILKRVKTHELVANLDDSSDMDFQKYTRLTAIVCVNFQHSQKSTIYHSTLGWSDFSFLGNFEKKQVGVTFSKKTCIHKIFF